MKKIFFLLSLAILFASNLSAQSVLLTPNKVESKQSSAIDNIILQSTNLPNIQSKRQNGTLAVPSPVLLNDDLLSIQTSGYNGTGFTGVRSAIKFEATENWAANNNGTSIKFTTTANGTANPIDRLTIADDGKVGIGIIPTVYNLDVYATSDAGVGVHRFGGNAPAFYGISARGTKPSPTETLTGDVLARFGGKGYNGNVETAATARIDMTANEDWTSFAAGTDIKFYTTALGQTSTTEKMTIRGNGNVGINKPDAESSLTVNGDFQLMPEKFVHNSDANLTALNRNGKSVIRFGGTGKVDLKGIGGGVDGLVIHIYSIRGANPTLGNNKIIEIHDESPDANLENRILTGEPYVGVNGVGQNLIISNDGGVTLIYDGTANRWRVIGVQR